MCVCLCAFPPLFLPCAGVLKGLEESMTTGNLAGFPVVDVTCTLYDGSYHEVDSSALAFQIAARGAFREAMQKCGARLLEPVMKVCAVCCVLRCLYMCWQTRSSGCSGTAGETSRLAGAPPGRTCPAVVSSKTSCSSCSHPVRAGACMLLARQRPAVCMNKCCCVLLLAAAAAAAVNTHTLTNRKNNRWRSSHLRTTWVMSSET